MKAGSIGRWSIRGAVVATTIGALVAAGAGIASARPKSPYSLCLPHGGVYEIRPGEVECNDGSIFDLETA